MLALLLMLAAQDAPDPAEVVITSQGGNRYLITVERFDMAERPAIEAEEQRRAAEICGGKFVSWASLSVGGPTVGAARPMLINYRHGFECLDINPASYPAAPADWQPTAQDETDLRRAFTDYYAKRAAGDYVGAYNMFETEYLPDREGWIANARRVGNAVGSGTLRITGVRWSVNPPNAPHPGAYGILTFEGDFPAMAAVCGRVSLYRKGPGVYRLTEDTFNYLSHARPPLTPEALRQTKREQCPR